MASEQRTEPVVFIRVRMRQDSPVIAKRVIPCIVEMTRRGLFREERIKRSGTTDVCPSSIRK